MGPLTTHLFNSDEFKVKQEKLKSYTLSPHEVISSGDFKQSTYCHLLLGLFFADEVESVASIYAYSIAQAFSALEEAWEDLCADIKGGTLNPRIDNPALRKAVLEIIFPNPSRVRGAQGSGLARPCSETMAQREVRVLYHDRANAALRGAAQALRERRAFGQL